LLNVSGDGDQKEVAGRWGRSPSPIRAIRYRSGGTVRARIIGTSAPVAPGSPVYQASTGTWSAIRARAAWSLRRDGS